MSSRTMHFLIVLIYLRRTLLGGGCLENETVESVDADLSLLLRSSTSTYIRA